MSLHIISHHERDWKTVSEGLRGVVNVMKRVPDDRC